METRYFFGLPQDEAARTRIFGSNAFRVLLRETVGQETIALLACGETGIPLLTALLPPNEELELHGSDGYCYQLTPQGLTRTQAAAHNKAGRTKYWLRMYRRYLHLLRRREKQFQKDKADCANLRENAVLPDGRALWYPAFRRLKYYHAASAGRDCCPRFRLYAPRGEKPYPLLVFLHSAGVFGQDNFRHMLEAQFWYLRLRFRGRRCAVLAPQLGVKGRYNSEEHSEILGEMVDWALRETKADANRIYLSGLSYGAHGALYEALRRPGRYAAVLLVSGWWYTKSEMARVGQGETEPDIYHSALDETLCSRLKDVPLSFVHSENDRVCPVTGLPQEELQAAGVQAQYDKRQRFGHAVFIPYILFHAWDEWILGF